MWKHIDSNIHVITEFRSLGAHLTTRHATSSNTLDKRWGGKAKHQLRKLRLRPAKAGAKAKVILSKIYAGARYGVEAAGASPQKVASLPAAVIDVFKSRNNNHNANQFFSTITASKNDLDPLAQMFARRVMQIRRIVCSKKKGRSWKVQEHIGNLCN